MMFFLRLIRQAYHRTFVQRPMPSAEFTTQILKCDPSFITFSSSSSQPNLSAEALEVLRAASHHLCDLSETVVFPTETVYGLGAVATSAQASAKIFAVKGRPPDNPLIVHVSSLTMLQSLLPAEYRFSRAYQVLMKHFWPGALTLLFPRNPDIIPTVITANQPTVAVRMPSHPVARALIAVANVPLAAPSANTSGKPSPTKAEHVFRDLAGKVSVIIDGGACGVGLESTVVDGLHEDGNIRVLRPGGITVEQIERVLREELGDCDHIPKVLVHIRDYQDQEMEHAPTTPGMKYRHYSPSVPVILLCTISRPPQGQTSSPVSVYLGSFLPNSLKGPKVKIGVLAPSDSDIWQLLESHNEIEWHRYPLGPIAEPSVTAQRLFDGMLTLENQNVDMIIIEEIKEEHEGLAVMNRVRKAASETKWLSYHNGSSLL